MRDAPSSSLIRRYWPNAALDESVRQVMDAPRIASLGTKL